MSFNFLLYTSKFAVLVYSDIIPRTVEKNFGPKPCTFFLACDDYQAKEATELALKNNIQLMVSQFGLLLFCNFFSSKDKKNETYYGTQNPQSL